VQDERLISIIFNDLRTPLRKIVGYVRPSKSCPTRSGVMPSRNPETRIVRRQSRTTRRVYPQVSVQLSPISEESQTTGRRSPITAACHWDVIYDRILKPTTPSRNLLLKPYILWLRDSERLPTAGVYSGHLSSQGLQVQTLKPGEANSCNPLLQNF
jgi:hypothetical protein